MKKKKTETRLQFKINMKIGIKNNEVEQIFFKLMKDVDVPYT